MKEKLFNLINPIPCRNRRLRIIINQVVLPLFIFSILWSYHLVLFSKVYEKDNFIIYSNKKDQTKELQLTIDSILTLLELKNIEIKKTVRIFLTSNENEYNKATFYLSKYSKGVAYPIINRIIINSNIGEFRTIKELIIHELIHIYQYQQYGIIRTNRLPTWKIEGMCDFIAESSSISETEGLHIFIDEHREQLVLNSMNIKSQEYKYYKYRMYYDYLVNQKFMTIDEIFINDINIVELEKEIRLYLKTNFST